MNNFHKSIECPVQLLSMTLMTENLYGLKMLILR